MGVLIDPQRAVYFNWGAGWTLSKVGAMQMLG
jgi:hypothetical protein